MNKENKKKQFVSILSKLAQERRDSEKKLVDHHFYLKQVVEKNTLFNHLIYQAILKQAEDLSLAFGKPYQYQTEEEEKTRLGKEALETFDRSALLRATRVGPLTLIG